MAESIAGILASFKQVLSADKKKTAILCVLFLVLMVVLVRQFVFGSTVEPAAAAASAVVASPTEVAQPEVLIRPTVEVAGVASPSRAVAVVSASGNTGRPHPVVPRSEKVVSVEGLPRTLTRNIFDTPAWSRFAHFSGSSGAGHRGSQQEGPPGLLMRIGRTLATYGRSRRETERQIDQDLTKLRLESTMTGQVPLAHISGRLVREGDQVEGFSVLQIRDRQVMLRKAGVTRVLNMP